MKSNIGRFFVLSGFIVFYVAFFLDTYKDGDNFYKFEAVMIIVYPFLLAFSFSKNKCLHIFCYSFLSTYSLFKLFCIFNYYNLYLALFILIISYGLLLISSLVYLIESMYQVKQNIKDAKRVKKLNINAPSRLMLYKELLDNKTISKDDYEKVKTNFINCKKHKNNIEKDIALIKEWKSLLDLKLINDDEFKNQKEKILFGENKNLQH